MSARFTTSEPPFRAPVSQWQSERARGVLRPLETPADRRFNRYCYWLGLVPLIAAVALAHFGVHA